MGLAEARRIARAVSERGGGLPAVEAMALPHGDRAECWLAEAFVKTALMYRSEYELLFPSKGLIMSC